jgi:hypothetical protein
LQTLSPESSSAVVERDEQQYRVTGAILSQRPEGRVWTLTFSALRSPRGLPVDAEAGKDVVITVSPSEVDNLFFDTTYTLADIDAIPRYKGR